jgi:hypothetical protein
MAGLGRKVFTAGDVLTASDVQNYMMDQSVMYFAGTAARSSAIATPTTGMTTYIGTTGTATIPQIESYTGSAFQTLYGLTQLANVDFTSAASVTIDNVFSATYLSYLMIGNFAVAANSNLNINLRDAGADLGGTSYSSSWYYNQQTGTTAGADSSFGGANINMQKSNACRGFYGRVEFFQPFTSTFTHFNWHSTQFDGTIPFGFTGTGSDSAARVASGFKINTPSSTMTGNIRIYGLRNS